MKLRNLLFAAITSFTIAGSLAPAVWATDTRQPEPRTVQPDTGTETQTNSEGQSDAEESTKLPAPTFSSETTPGSSSLFWFGKNVFYAGNNVTVNNISRGLLIAAGNNLQLESQSEYAFAAGNTIVFRAAIEKDLFLAGNTVSITNDAKVGRDVFATGNTFSLEADLSGDVSVAAGSIVLNDVVIKGNANFDAETITFQGQVQIDGTLNYNDDATVSGLTNVKYGKLETHVSASRSTTAGEIWLTKMMSVAGLFFTIAIIFLVFPGAKQAIAREADVQRFGVDLMLGFGFVMIVPLLTLIFLMSFFAVSTSIFLIVVYCLVFYLATAFVGAWLGHVIVEKLCHCTLPMLVEALIGILLIACASMIPGLSFIVSTLTLVLGAGLIMACLRSGSDKKQASSDDKHIYYAATETPAKPSKSSRPAKKTSATKLATAKSPSKSPAMKSPTKTSATKSSSAKTSTNPAVKTPATKKSKTPKTKK